MLGSELVSGEGTTVDKREGCFVGSDVMLGVTVEGIRVTFGSTVGILDGNCDGRKLESCVGRRFGRLLGSPLDHVEGFEVEKLV